MENSICKDIELLKIQGSAEITLASLKYLKNFSKLNGFGKKFDREAEKLISIRPTAVMLYNTVQILKKKKGTIDELIKRVETDKEKIALNGFKLIKHGYRVHTHCHSSEALSVIKKSAEKNKLTVVVDITQPKSQGIRTAKELAKIRNIDVILIPDTAAGLALSPPVLPMDNIVIVGSDALRKEGVVNKIGTYLLAVASSEQNIPFYVAASTLKLDKRKKFKIEERPATEVYRKIKGVTIRNPAFDITPWKYITGVITEEGIKKPREILMMLK